MSARSIEPDLWAVPVEEAKFALLDGTSAEYAAIGDGDDYAVRAKGRPNVEIRRPGDDWRALSALLGRGPGGEQSAEGLHEIAAERYETVAGTGLEYTKLNDHDAYSVRDPQHPDNDIRLPGNDWRKLGSIV